MKRKKDLMPKIVAGVALFAIIIGIVGTGVLVVISSFSQDTGTQISQEELQQYLETLSGATITQTGGVQGELGDIVPPVGEED